VEVRASRRLPVSRVAYDMDSRASFRQTPLEVALRAVVCVDRSVSESEAVRPERGCAERRTDDAHSEDGDRRRSSADADVFVRRRG
jgi:hypothetical protein